MKPASDAVPTLIDTDPGIDDALALLMAFASPRIEVVGLCVGAGNVGLRHTLANTRKLCAVAAVDVPIHPGCDRPLLFPARDAAYVHGRDGFGDVGCLPANTPVMEEHAVQALLRLSHAYAGRLQLVMLGPLTHLALALRLDPELPARIARLVVMGGAVTGHGNISAHAEFNFAFDPEAAHIVCTGFPAFELVDWEAVLRHGYPAARFVHWLAAGDHRARFYGAISRGFRDWMQAQGNTELRAADALAMATVLHPEGIVRRCRHRIAIDTGLGPARGASIVDWDDRSGEGALADILLDYDQAMFERLLASALGA